MSFWLKFARAFGVVCLSTLVTVIGSNLLSLGAFADFSPLGAVSFAVCLTAFAYVCYYALALVVYFTLRYKTPGIFLFTVLGVAGGAAALIVLSLTAPELVTMSALAAAGYAFVVTMLTWAFATAFGITRAGLKFWPQW